MPSFDMLGLMLFEAADLWLDGCRGPSGVAIGGGRHCRDVCFLRQRTCCCVGAGDLQA
jgi:hypothetical protein